MTNLNFDKQFFNFKFYVFVHQKDVAAPMVQKLFN